MRSIANVFSVLTCLALSGASLSQTPPTPYDLSEQLAPILEKYKLPGLVAAVIDGDRVSAIGAVGVRKHGSPEPMTKNDQIHLGSDTKAMTAVLIGMLVDAKQLTFATTLAEALPDLADKMHPDCAKATILQVMSHTAGLPANIPWALFSLGDKTLVEQRRMVVEQVLAKAPASPPGTKFDYSNVDYVLLGAILEAKTGKAWEALIQEKLFKPLGMTSAGFGPPGKTGAVEQPWGHILVNETMTPAQVDNPEVIGPAGRAHMSLEDWAKFIALFLDAKQGKPRLLSAESFATLTTPVPPSDYAGGWLVGSRPWGGRVLTHSGSNTTWFCVAWVAPERNFAILIATNFGGPDAPKACDEATGIAIRWHAQQQAAQPK